jgi:hypothetical protein
MSSVSHQVLPIGYPQCLCTESQWCVFVFHVHLFSILLFTFMNNINDFKNSPILSLLRICNVGKKFQCILFVHTLHLNQYIHSLFLYSDPPLPCHPPS